MARVTEAVWDGFALANAATGLATRFDCGANVVLTFHSVGAPGRFGNVSTDRFRGLLTELARRYELVDLPAVLEQGDGKRIAITFDDGRQDVSEQALPILQDLDVPATLFLVEGEIGAADFVTAEQVADLIDDDLVTIGNHTTSHPNLSELEGEALVDEIEGAKERLESRFEVSIERFSYPRGDHSPDAVDVVRDSHELAVSTRPRVVPSAADPHLIPRIKGHLGERRLRWEITPTASRVREFASNVGVVTR